MITFEESLNIIKENKLFFNKKEKINLYKSIGRIVSKDYYSNYDIPPFDKSAMDGYVISNKNNNQYKIINLIKAGEYKDFLLNDNECAEIMTGSPVNKNGIMVIPYENTEKNGDMIKIINMPKQNNICYKGEDIKKGELLLKKNTILSQFSIGSLASNGDYYPEVYKKLKIGFCITGDELINKKNNKITEGKIRDCNSFTLSNIINSIPFCKGVYYGIIKDNLKQTINIIKKFEKSDQNILLFSGGASKGKFDFVLKALEDQNFNILFNSISIKPGKPTIFAKKNNKIIFGLPGNPVSVLTIFELLVKETIYQTFDIDYNPIIVKARLNEDIKINKNDRDTFLPVKINIINDELYCNLVNYNGSAHITAFNNVKYIIKIKKGIGFLKKGDFVYARFIWPVY